MGDIQWLLWSWRMFLKRKTVRLTIKHQKGELGEAQRTLVYFHWDYGDPVHVSSRVLKETKT